MTLYLYLYFVMHMKFISKFMVLKIDFRIIEVFDKSLV